MDALVHWYEESRWFSSSPTLITLFRIANNNQASHHAIHSSDYLVPSLLAFDSFMKTGGNCSFLYDHYHKIEARLCSAALPAMLNVGFAMLLNALFGIVMVSMGLLINKRFGGHGNTSSGNADKTVSGAVDGFEGDENEFSEIMDDEEEDEDEPDDEDEEPDDDHEPEDEEEEPDDEEPDDEEPDDDEEEPDDEE